MSMTSSTTNLSLSHLEAMLPAKLQPFVTISYPVWGVENGHRVLLYKKGRNDLYFVLFMTAFFAVLRHVTMNWLFAPIAHRYMHVPNTLKTEGADKATKERRLRAYAKKKQHAVIRFAEQGWNMLYCLVMEVIGLTILSRIPHPGSPEQLWGTYPVTPIPGLTKVYYLVQLAWWFHQVCMINVEKRRKDYSQMLFHHFVSIALVSLSYLGNLTRVGTVVHTLMDVVDILLPAAKLLRYLGYKKACDAAFVVFLVGWILTRQIGFAMVTYSAAVNAPKFIAFDWNPAKQHYFTKSVHTAFIVLLCLLLTLCTIWFYMAIMVAVRVVRGQGAEDTRSDSEDFAENDEDDEVEHRGNGHANGHANGNGAANGHKSHALNGHALNGHGALNGHATVLSTSAPNGYASANGLKRRL